MVSSKRFMARCLSAWMIATGLTGALGGARAAEQVGPFDFSYRISGDRAARPMQVFDNGASKTYFQFPVGVPVPLVLVGRGPDMVVPEVEGPYHTVTGRALAYTLVLPGHTARVEHATLPPQSASRSPLSTGPALSHAGDRTLSSYATPVRGDVIEWIELEQQAAHDMVFVGGSAQLSPAARETLLAVSKRLGAQAKARILVSGADARNALTRKRVERVRQTLIDHGLAARHIEVEREAGAQQTGGRAASVINVQWRAPGQASKPPPSFAPLSGDNAETLPGRPVARNFDIFAGDLTVSAVLQRWARQSGYRLDWVARIDPPVTGEPTHDTGQFPEAASRVIAGLRASGHPLRLDVPSEHVVRVFQTN